jgi:hypothetical protein
MNKWRSFCLAFAVLLVSSIAMGQEQGVVKPQLLVSEMVPGMPKGEKQEVRVLIYVLEGAFTLEIEGREPVTVKAGQGMIMPPRVKMTGYNRSSTDPLRLVLFNVSDPDTPYLDPVH